MTVVASVIMPLLAVFLGVAGLVASFAALLAAVGAGFFVALPRRIAEGDRRAGGRSVALGRALRRLQWTTAGGAVIAAATVGWLVWRMGAG